MPKPPLDPPVADEAPTAGDLTDYDRERLVTYLRLLDAGAALGNDAISFVARPTRDRLAERMTRPPIRCRAALLCAS